QIKRWINSGAKETRTIGDVRGRGLMIGVEMVKDKKTREPLDGDSVGNIIMGMLNRGLVMVPCGRYGNVFRFMPPLILTKDHAQKASEILLETVKAVEAGKG
ncbi:aminotransferase class III-fold pyridoxal phosphate-dependent enzyme, partial [Thermodesulfobacteriota bacterium]